MIFLQCFRLPAFSCPASPPPSLSLSLRVSFSSLSLFSGAGGGRKAEEARRGEGRGGEGRGGEAIGKARGGEASRHQGARGGRARGERGSSTSGCRAGDGQAATVGRGVFRSCRLFRRERERERQNWQKCPGESERGRVATLGLKGLFLTGFFWNGNSDDWRDEDSLIRRLFASRARFANSLFSRNCQSLIFRSGADSIPPPLIIPAIF